MKKIFYLLVFFSINVFAQNGNPYEIFGYKGNVLDVPKEQQRFEIEQKTKQNPLKLFLDFKNNDYYITRNDSVIKNGCISSDLLLRWVSTDPLEKKYPGLSPYSSFANSPIFIIDAKGSEIKPLSGNDVEILNAAFGSFGDASKIFGLTTRTGTVGKTTSFNIFTSSFKTQEEFETALKGANLSVGQQAQAKALFQVLSSKEIIEIGVIGPSTGVTQTQGVPSKQQEFIGSTNPSVVELLKTTNPGGGATESSINTTLAAPKSEGGPDYPGITTGGATFGLFREPPTQKQQEFIGTLLINPPDPTAASFGPTPLSPGEVTKNSVIESIQKIQKSAEIISGKPF